jgi:lipoate-protein ligase A
MASPKAWELRLDPPADGETNMRIDRELLEALEQAPGAHTIVRFYAWARPTLSLGRNQKAEAAADLEFCRSRGIDVVRRPTGGQAVLHDDELTYAVVSNDLDSFGGDSVYGTYRRVSEALAEGYRSLGVPVVLAAGGARTHPPGNTNPCFATPSRFELMAGGRKLVGSAQRRLRRAFLQHGSMPIRIDRELLAGATRYGSRETLASAIVPLAECLGEAPDRRAITLALVRAFEVTFGVRLEHSGPVRGAFNVL